MTMDASELILWEAVRVASIRDALSDLIGHPLELVQSVDCLRSRFAQRTTRDSHSEPGGIVVYYWDAVPVLAATVLCEGFTIDLSEKKIECARLSWACHKITPDSTIVNHNLMKKLYQDGLNAE